MQIHELTKKTLAEASIADRIKTAGTAVAQAVKNPRQTVQQAKQGFDDKMAAANVSAGQAKQNEIQTQAAQYAAKLRAQGYTGQTAAAPTSAVQPGQRVLVVSTQPNGTKANYYKTDKGWENELGKPVTDATSIAYLEKLYTAQVKPAAVTGITSQAGAVMTSVDVDRAIQQLGLTRQQLQAFQAQATQNPGFVRAFLKRLGLVR